MKEKEKNALVSVEEYESRIAVIRGLINYHKRMVALLDVNAEAFCNKKICPAVAFENDVYLDALEEALRLMEREITVIGS